MYNKLFAKILDSSVWLEPTPTRIVWLTLIAAMDEDGMVQFASVSNVAHRARVSEDEAGKAIQTLESPDKNSADPDNEGRRIERVPGGWIVLNSKKYRDLSNREIAKEKTRQRVAKFREKQRCNAGVTVANDSVTTSEAYTDTDLFVPAEPKQKKVVVEIPPPKELLLEYGGTLSLTPDDVDAFVDHHTARGWILSNGRKMKDWKAALRTWKRTKNKFNQTNAKNNGHGKPGSTNRNAGTYNDQPADYSKLVRRAVQSVPDAQ